MAVVFPLIALLIGFAGFFLFFCTYYTQGALFALFPLFAFVFGYFSSWKIGLLSGLLLFLGYNISFLIFGGSYGPDNFIDLGLVFVRGGILLCLVGALAPTVRKGLRNPKAIMALVALVLAISYCGYLIWPAHAYSYHMRIMSSASHGDIELYLPLATISGEPYTELYSKMDTRPEPITCPPSMNSIDLTSLDLSLEIVDTEHGEMLRMYSQYHFEGTHSMLEGGKYCGAIGFRDEESTLRMPQLAPKYDNETVPVKASSSKEVDVEIRLFITHKVTHLINFHPTFKRTQTLIESVSYEGSTSDNWVLISIETSPWL